MIVEACCVSLWQHSPRSDVMSIPWCILADQSVSREHAHRKLVNNPKRSGRRLVSWSFHVAKQQNAQDACASQAACAAAEMRTSQVLHMQLCLHRLAFSCSMLVVTKLLHSACSVQLCRSHMHGSWANDHMLKKTLCQTTIML